MPSSFYSTSGVSSENITAIESSTTAAANSATAAANSATDAETAKLAAQAAEGASAAAASISLASEGAAANSATAASNSEAAALASRNLALQHQNNASTFATNSSNSATSAYNAQVAAETAQTASEAAQTASETAQTAAETAETNAEAALTSFQEAYRTGATDPTTSLDTGDLFYNTTDSVLKIYNGSAWEAGGTAGSGFLATTGGSLTGNLTIENSNVKLDLKEDDTTDVNTRLQSNNSTFRIKTLSDDGSTETQRITVDHTTGDISFYEDTGTNAKLFWDASEEALGFNTTTPTADIHMVKGNDIHRIRMDSDRPAANNLIGRTEFYWNGTEVAKIDGATGPSTGTKDDGQLRFWTKDTGNSIAQRLTISSTGHVGVNTSNPIATLQVNDIGTTGPAVHIVGGSGDEGDITVPHTETFQLGHWNSSTNTFSERMRVHDDGTLSFGSISSKTKALFSGSSGSSTNLADTDNLLDMDTQGFITVENLDDTAGAEAGIIFRSKTNFAGAWSNYVKQSGNYIGDLIWRQRSGGATSAERMRLTNAGDLLVGKNVQSIDTVGVTLVDGQVTATADDASAIRLNRKTSDGSIVDLRKDGTTVGSIGANGTKMYTGSGATGLYFNRDDASIEPYNPSTITTRDDAIDLGKSTGGRFKDLFLSGTANVDRLVIDNVTDASFTSTDHGLQIGPSSGGNMIFDANEIMARNNGAASILRLNHEGGIVQVNNAIKFEGNKIFTDSGTMDFSVDDNADGSNQQFRWSEGGVVRMTMEDNDLYVGDNINAGYKYETAGTNRVFETTSSHISAYSGEVADGSGTEYRTFIQSYNTTDPDVAVFQCFSKDVMADTGSTSHNEDATAHLLDNGGRVWSWQSQYAGRVRVGSTATTTAYRAADNSFTCYSGTGNSHGAGTYAGYTQIVGRDSSNTDDVFLVHAGGQPKIEFDANGNGYFDGGADLGNADYAEYFEWADGNPNNEDRRGYPVVLASDGKIRVATTEDDTADFIGIVSVEAAIVGDSAWAAWTGKYERDRFGQKVYEDHELLCWGPYDEDTKSYKTQTTRQAMIDAGREADIPEDAITVVKQRHKLSADYDPEREYIPRKDRQEWVAIGLMGKLPLIKGQPTAANWKKLFDLNDEVEMWLVR